MGLRVHYKCDLEDEMLHSSVIQSYDFYNVYKKHYEVKFRFYGRKLPRAALMLAALFVQFNLKILTTWRPIGENTCTRFRFRHVGITHRKLMHGILIIRLRVASQRQTREAGRETFKNTLACGDISSVQLRF